MKKILYCSLLTILSQTTFCHIPQNGPLELGDQVQMSQLTATRTVVKRGVIMNNIITNSNFSDELTTIYKFLNLPVTQPLPSYEELVDIVQISTNSRGAIAVLEAFEKAIIEYLNYNHYLCSVEGKVINIFFTGIKYDWFYPSAWINIDCWLSNNMTTEMHQLINELEQLAIIASKHSVLSSIRLKMKVNSYRNWKRNTLVFMSTLGAISAGWYLKNKVANS